MKCYLACFVLVALLYCVKGDKPKSSNGSASSSVLPTPASFSLPVITSNAFTHALPNAKSSSSIQPNMTASAAISPNNTNTINLNVTSTMNPNNTKTINPNMTSTLNPNNTKTINPNMTSTMNTSVTHTSSNKTAVSTPSSSASASKGPSPTHSSGKSDKDYDNMKKRMWIAASFAIIFAITTVILACLVYRQRRINRELEGDPATSRLL